MSNIFDIVKAKAEALVLKGAVKDEQDGIAKVFRDDPALYERYRGEAPHASSVRLLKRPEIEEKIMMRAQAAALRDGVDDRIAVRAALAAHEKHAEAVAKGEKA